MKSIDVSSMFFEKTSMCANIYVSAPLVIEQSLSILFESIVFFSPYITIKPSTQIG